MGSSLKLRESFSRAGARFFCVNCLYGSDEVKGSPCGACDRTSAHRPPGRVPSRFVDVDEYIQELEDEVSRLESELAKYQWEW
jgi:hypothetical protein